MRRPRGFRGKPRMDDVQARARTVIGEGYGDFGDLAVLVPLPVESSLGSDRMRPPPLHSIRNGFLALLALVLAGCGRSGEERRGDLSAATAAIAPAMLSDPAACRDCHAEAVAAWQASDHALANRELGSADAAVMEASLPDGVRAGADRFRFDAAAGAVGVARSGREARYPVDGVIGRRPLFQYLIATERGRLQVSPVAWDPAAGEYFDVFAGDERSPGEWGHWSGQGMNWNSNCAWCHMTGFEENYDPVADTYRSRWQRQGIGCAQCHSGLAEHLVRARAGEEHRPESLSIEATLENCASCHSRREELTANRFVPGERYADHFRLSLPDRPGLYHPDGQILDEVFVYGSFRMSRMGNSGVRCADCHEPHGLELILPAENNALCQRCHETGALEAPIIDPVAHSHHQPESSGNRCVECHMPETVYMQRDPRRDHGFLSPDPLMTLERGIPNACNGCHQDQSPEWAAAAVAEWYPESERLARQRRRARAHDPDEATGGVEPSTMLALARDEDIPAWRAAHIGRLAEYIHLPAVREFVAGALKDADPVVRERAVAALAADAGDDPVRAVRIATARAREGAELTSGLQAEWSEYLQVNADRPMGAFFLSLDAMRSGDLAKAARFIELAVSHDPVSPMARREAAVLYSRIERSEDAERHLAVGLVEAPRDTDLLFSMALLQAERGNLKAAIAFFEDTVAAAPGFGRAWYNLSIALLQSGQVEEAAGALQRAGETGQVPPREIEAMRAAIGNAGGDGLP